MFEKISQWWLKIKELSPRKKKRILWSVVILIGLLLLTWWFFDAAHRVENFSPEVGNSILPF